MNPNDPSTWDFSGVDAGSIPSYSGYYTPTDYGSVDMSGFDAYASDPGFQQWLNSGAYLGSPGYDTPNTMVGTQAPSFNLSGMLSGIDPKLASTLLGLGGTYLQQQNYQNAAQKSAAQQLAAMQQAAAMSKFKPVGVTTRFGESKFGYDNQGNLINAGYQLAPDLQYAREQLMNAGGGMLNQFTRSQAETAPMGLASERMMALGNQYLSTDPQAQAQKYYNDQQKVLEAGRASAMAALQAQMQAQGRGGFAIGGDAGMGAANPQLQALLNAQLQQDRELAATATQGGMDYAKFGSGMVGSGGQMLRDMYATQVGSYAPFQQAVQGAGYLEGLGQQAMDIGTKLGSNVTAGNQSAAQLIQQGSQNAAQTQMLGQQGAGSMWGGLLQGGAKALSQWGT